MSNKDSKNEREKSFPERLKKFLKSEKKNVKPLPEIKISDEVKYDLGPNAPLETRMKTVRELEESVQIKKLQDSSVEKIWIQIKDMLNMNNPTEVRHAVISLLSTIAATLERLGHRRLLFLKYIMDNYKHEDIVPLFNFFQCVINDGRSIEYIEEEVGPFFIKWLPTLISSYPSTVSVIDLTTNLLKFNAAHIDDHIIREMGILIINQVHQSKSKEELYSCLKFMDTLVAYVFIPSGTLMKFVSTLARLVSIPFIVTDSWKVMRKLLCTELGNSALCSLFELIENSDNFHVVRGSIYFLTCALWSKQKISSLTFGPMAVLPTLLRASDSVHPLIIYETAISISKLVRNHSEELHISSWDIVLNILGRLFFFTSNYSNKEQAQMIFNVLNSIVDDIEKRIEDEEFYGAFSKFYDLVDCCSKLREVESVSLTLDFKIRTLQPDQNQWLNSLNSLIQRHFRAEVRPSIRLQALSKLRYIFDNFRGTNYAEQICEQVVAVQLNEIEKDPEMVVRKASVSLFIHMVITLQVPVVKNILNFIERIVLAPYDKVNIDKEKVYMDKEADDIYEGVRGLILVFKKKIWCLPSSYAIDAYQILMSVLELHYRNPNILEKVSYIRKEIFEMIFEMRADANYHLGLPNCPDAQIPVSPDDPEDLKDFLPKFTPYIVVDHKHGQKPNSGYSLYNESSPRSSYEEEDVPLEDEASLEENENENERLEELNRQCESEEQQKEGISINVREENLDEDVVDSAQEDNLMELESMEPLTVVTHLSLTKAAMTVIVAMKKEKDWELLSMILEKVPQVLQNKALILSKDGNDIDYLATTLCALISDTELQIPESLHNTPCKFSKSDFDAYVYPVMASLSSYHQHLDSLYQRNIIQCLQNGMSSKSAPQCVSAMTLCVLEMRHTMTKLLRDVMIRLSKISATIQNAQPTLEFLSTLLHLPRVYSDFLPSQYLSVFAISIPYTNPFKFNHYIVSLAYHVICMWFMKCRIPHRKGFVNFISKNLNMILLNEDTPTKIKASVPAGSDQTGKVDPGVLFQFHKDLRETCVDFMARNCFDSYSPETTRSPLSQMLFDKGQQQTWLVGTRIITVTTSGCSRKPIKRGLCDKCVQFCLPEDFNACEVPSQPDSTVSGRRHKSDFHRSVSHEVKHQPQTKDDLHMRSSQFNQYSDQGDRVKNIDELLISDQDEKKCHICVCWCSRWAEIMIRQPTGTVSYAMRISNAQTHIVKEDLVPIQDLSSFYSPFSQGSDPTGFVKDLLLQDGLYDSFLPQPTDQIRPRASSGASDRTQASETGLGLGEEWSNSGSGHSSGATSLASSETKLNSRVEVDTVKDPNQLPVYHCYSSPEVNKGLMEASANVDEKFSKHPSLAHSMSLVEQPLKSLEQEQQKCVHTSAQSSFDKPKSGVGNGAVKRCNSSVGSPSPTPVVEQTNRIRHASAMQTKSCASPVSVCDKEEDPSLQPVKRGRGHTISDMNPASRNRNTRSLTTRRPTIASTTSLLNTVCATTASTTSLPSDSASTIASSYSTSLTSSSKSNKEVKGGISPSSVFLQLYYQGCFGSSPLRPILLPMHNRDIERAIKVMDLIKPHEHHRVGVVYVGPNQTTEAEIFNNTSGSDRYHQFLDGLSSVYEISEFPDNANLGGLDKRGIDGHLIHMWQDDLMQVVFHVATTMPNKESDPNCNNKKQHIGNDFVTIVYNNSGRPYEINTIKSQLSHSVVEITPGDHNTNCVTLLSKPVLKEFVSWGNDFPRLVSDASLPLLGRQLAIHANLASTVWQSLKHSQAHPYATNWLEWLRRVRKLRELVLSKSDFDHKSTQEVQALQFPPQDSVELQNQAYLDFTDMIELDKAAQDVKDRSRTAGFLNRR